MHLMDAVPSFMPIWILMDKYMHPKCILWFCLIIQVLCSEAVALEEIGAEILDTCLSERQALSGDATAGIRYGLCLGYLKGIADTLNGSEFCLPETGETALITQRLKQVYINYAFARQGALNLPATRIVVPALREAFPCGR